MLPLHQIDTVGDDIYLAELPIPHRFVSCEHRARTITGIGWGIREVYLLCCHWILFLAHVGVPGVEKILVGQLRVFRAHL